MFIRLHVVALAGVFALLFPVLVVCTPQVYPSSSRSEVLSIMSKYEDIEMLQIPDDDVSVTSDSERIDDISTTASVSPSNDADVFFSSTQTNEPNLQEWFSGERALTFEYNEDKYEKSIPPNDSDANAYVDFINHSYKVLEKLSQEDMIPAPESSTNQSRLGVVSQGFGIDAYRQKQQGKVSLAFGDLVSHCKQLVEQTSNPSVLSRFNCLQYILECLHANNFYPSLALKPALIGEWVNHFDPQPPNELVQEIMVDTAKPYLHQDFWTRYIPTLIIRGLHDVTTNVLESSGFEELKQFSPKLFEVIEDLITIVSNYQPLSLKGQFADWKQSLLGFRDAVSLVLNEVDDKYKVMCTQIYDVSCILSGMEKTTSQFCQLWYDLFLALLLYKVRDEKDIYSLYFEVAIHEKPVGIVDVTQDEFLLAQQAFIDILQGDYLKVLSTIYNLNPGVAAYVAKFMEYHDMFANYYNTTVNIDASNSSISRRTYSEYFLTRHAYDCLNLHPLVPVGIGILMNPDMCLSTGAFETNRDTVAKFLPNYECQTNDDMEWAVTVCAKFELDNTKRRLYFDRGMSSFHQGMLYEALNNFCGSFDVHEPSLYDPDHDGLAKIHYICWEVIFASAVMQSRPVDDDLINNVVSRQVTFKVHPVISQNLSPYAVLYEFFKLLEQAHANDLREPLDVRLRPLIHLLRFNYLPKKFYPLLLCQLLPFVLASNTRFKLSDLIILIELLSNYELAVTKEERAEGVALFTEAISDIDDDRTSYDWRVVLKERNRQIPQLVPELIALIRNEITKKVGEVFIGKY